MQHSSIWAVWNNSSPDGAYYILGAFSTEDMAKVFEAEMNDREYPDTHIEKITINPPYEAWPGETRKRGEST